MPNLSLIWFSLFIYGICISGYFNYLYLHDKDKRKLMFAISFYLSSVIFLIISLGFTGRIMETFFWHNFYYWSSLPILIAIHIYVNDRIIKIKNFNKIFNIFIFVTVLSLLTIFFPLKLSFLYTLFSRILTIAIIAGSFYLIIRFKNLVNVMFLLSMVSFTIAGVSLVSNSYYLSNFAYFVAFSFIVLIFATPIYLQKKDKDGINSYFSLKKEYEKVQESLYQTEKKYKKLIDSSPDLIAEINLDGTIILANKSMAESLGKNQNQLMGSNIFEILPTDDINERKKKSMEAISKGEIVESEDKRNNRFFHNIFIPMDNPQEQKSIQVIARDITEFKKVENKLEEKIKFLEKNEKATLNIMEDFQENIHRLKEAEKKIKDLNKNLEKKVDERTAEVKKLLKQKEEFINQLGHDLKTPLTPLINLLPLAKQRSKDKKTRELLDVAIKNADYMKNLVIKTLQLARINSLNEDKKLKFTKINLLDEINKIIENKKYLFEEHNIEIKNLVDGKISVQADKLAFNELINNILSNSVKYSKDGGKIIIDAKEDKDVTTISVADNGMGLTSEQIENVFDEFYKADKSRHDLESTGLGLAICKRIIEKHGQKIWAESPGLGKGTTFYFTFKKSDISKRNIEVYS